MPAHEAAAPPDASASECPSPTGPSATDEPIQITQIRQWLAGEHHPEHDTFSFGYGYGEVLIAAWDQRRTEDLEQQRQFTNHHRDAEHAGIELAAAAEAYELIARRILGSPAGTATLAQANEHGAARRRLHAALQGWEAHQWPEDDAGARALEVVAGLAREMARILTLPKRHEGYDLTDGDMGQLERLATLALDALDET